MDESVSRPIRWLVLITMGIGIGCISWQSYRDSQAYTLTPKKALTDELRSLPVPSGVESMGHLKFTDRDAFYYVDQSFSSSVTRDAVAKSYNDALLGSGWRQIKDADDEHHSLWFCKNGVLASVDFFGDADSPTYELSLITGGWVIKICG